MPDSSPQPPQIEKPTKIRTFLAVEMDESLRDGVRDILDRLQKGAQFTGAHPKWSAVDAMHLTLRFFGQTSDRQRREIIRAMRPIAKRHAPHTVQVRGLGVFPSPRRPRVVWLGVKKANPLYALQEDIDREMIEIGWEPEDREFAPHLTLARIKSLKRSGPLMDVVKSHSRCDLGAWPIRELILFQSTLRPEGAIYTPLERFALGK